ncbi:hypothetical protein ACFZC5_03460 [Nocardia gamkensis]|uniref:hypothetical protein n=1 Tax=Nocardia gamkensis TaxID=352869 RepID=UPI0036EE03E8
MDASSEQGLYSAGVAELERMAAYLRDESTPSRGLPTETPGGSAIGLRFVSVAGADAARDQATIEALARRHGYTLARTYVAAPQSVSMVVVAAVLEMVHVVRAGAVIVPGMSHLGGSVTAEFARVCSVVMPGHVMLGRALYPTCAPPPAGAIDAGVREW